MDDGCILPMTADVFVRVSVPNNVYVISRLGE